jgi:putative membrane protein
LLCIICGVNIGFDLETTVCLLQMNFIIKQSGAWDIDNTIVKQEKYKQLHRNCFGIKKADIGSVTIHTAGGNLSFQLGVFNYKDYVNLWLYKIEVSE